jgi:hypothetical protein
MMPEYPKKAMDSKSAPSKYIKKLVMKMANPTIIRNVLPAMARITEMAKITIVRVQ